MDRDNRPSRVGKLLGDQKLRAAVLEEKEHERVPYDTLENHDLHHEVAGEVAVHAFEERYAHDKSVGESGQGEEGDGPVQGAVGAEFAPEEEEREDDDFLERVGGEETEVHGVRVVGGDEVEREERDGEESHETVDAGALGRCEDFPPFDGAVSEDHGYV